MRQTDLAAAWVAIEACGHEDRSLRARLRWIAALLRQRPRRLPPGWWLISDQICTRIERAMTVGSAADCEVRIEGPRIEPVHAQILLLGSPRLQPAVPASPTWHNGQPVIATIELASGDVIQLGGTRLAVVRGEFPLDEL
jgi:hypothetical protein